MLNSNKLKLITRIKGETNDHFQSKEGTTKTEEMYAMIYKCVDI